MQRVLKARVTLVLAALIGAAGVLADPPPKVESRRIKPQDNYAAIALDAYGSGYALIERATRFEHDAEAALDDRARMQAQRGAGEAYQEALQSFEEAVRADERMYEAHTYIGYANRKLGRYDASLAAYAAALRLKPNYARAIEYQGEAYLGLDRFDDARFNYLRLYALDQLQAGKLLAAMREWAREREREPRGVSNSQLSAASAWLEAQHLDTTVTSEVASPW